MEEKPANTKGRLRQTYAHMRSPIAIAALLMATGCAVGPDFKRPDAPKVSNYTSAPLPAQISAANVEGGATQRIETGQDIPAQWWTSFHCEQLDALVAQSLKANPDLQSARSALRIAMENIKAQAGTYFPTVQAGYSATRSQNSTTLSPTLNNNILLYNLYQAQLSANWTPDIWGGNRRSVEALRAQADAQRFQFEATRLALATNVVVAAVQEASLRAQIAATSDIVQSEKDSLDILNRQYALGEIAGADVAAQQAALAQAEQALPPLQKQLAQQRDLLTALAGRLPSDEIVQQFELSALRLPEEVPVSVPSKLVEQRPDIRMAEGNLHAASAEIGVAIANMLPNITLSGNAGSLATQMGQLLTPGNQFWVIAGSATQTVFDGGTLLHKERASRETYNQASAQYRSTVVTAFQNVADTLHALQSDADLLAAASASEHAAADSLAITRRQLQLGSVSYLALLNAQQAYQQALVSRIQAQAGRLADTAVLFQALGGGWWNREKPVTVAKD